MRVLLALCGETIKTSKPGKNFRSFIIVQGHQRRDTFYECTEQTRDQKKKKSKYNDKVQSDVVGEIVKLQDVDMYIEG